MRAVPNSILWVFYVTKEGIASILRIISGVACYHRLNYRPNCFMRAILVLLNYFAMISTPSKNCMPEEF